MRKFFAGAFTCALIMFIIRVLAERGKRMAREARPDPSSGDLTVEVEEETYKLTFPDGSPVHEGELQEWLDQLRSDPSISDQEFTIAAGIVQQIRAHLN